MSRSGYIEDMEDNWNLIRWRGQVASAIRGKRGQAFLRELIAALDAMPERCLITHDLIRDGEVCAIGSVGRQRGLDMTAVDPEDYDAVADLFGIASPLVREIEFINDEFGWGDTTPERRWQIVRDWAAARLTLP